MLYAIIIGLILILIIMMVALVNLNKESDRKKHIQSVVRGNASVIESDKKSPSQDQRRSDLAKKLKKETNQKGDNKKSDSLSDSLLQAGLFKTSVTQFWVFSLILAIVMTALTKLSGQSNFVVIMMAITSFLGLPRLFLGMKIKGRQKKFLEDFADALEAKVRLLKAGMPVTEAISMVAREFSGPVGEEMGYIYDQQKMGSSLAEAASAGAQRMPLAEMKMFATAVTIQAQTGSSLSEVLENLANVIRARFRLKRKIQALSSEAKASSIIIAALPILVALGMYFVNREYIEILFTDPTGKVLLFGAIFWMVCGVLVIRQMINFKI